MVASEVKALANRSGAAIGEITALIQGIQGEIAQANAATRGGQAAVEEGRTLAQSAGAACVRGDRQLRRRDRPGQRGLKPAGPSD